MADFNQMGGLPTGYSDLLNAARQQLVKLPDGTYVQAPQFGGSTNIDELYKGIYPPALSAPPLVSRSVNTVPIDPTTGSPVGFTAPTMATTRTEQAGIRPAITQGTQPAGTATLPPGARPASVDRAFAQMQVPQVPQPGMFGRGARPASVGPDPFAEWWGKNVVPTGAGVPYFSSQPMGPTKTPQVAQPNMFGRGQPSVWDPFGTQVAKDTTRLPKNDGGEAGFLSTFYPDATNPAVDAIDITVNGGTPMPPLPRMRPIPPAMTPLTAVAPPSVPQRMTGNYTIKSGDTLGALAKRFGTTVNQLANANGIANPNKIKAGATLNLGYLAPPVPRMPPAALGRGYAKPRESRAERFSNLDEFGMIR